MKRVLTAEGREKIRVANFKRWFDEALQTWGDTFSYPNVETQYLAQKKPVAIECRLHGEFVTTPSKHLTYLGGGCPECGRELKAASKRKIYFESYATWLKDGLPAHLEPISPLVSPQHAMKFLCRKHKTIKLVKPVQLKNGNGYGCDLCAREASTADSLLTLESLNNEMAGSLPGHLTIVAVGKAGPKGGNVQMKCDRHGPFKTLTTTVRHGTYICPACATESMGFTSTRMLRLIDDGLDGQACWLAVMEVEVFGITTLKIGVTTRSLEQRYKWYLKKIHYAVQIPELLAYAVELRAKQKFSQSKDRRVFFAGMRAGQRWGGDTELFWMSKRDSIINFVRSEVVTNNVDLPNLKHLVEAEVTAIRKDEGVQREKDLHNLPLAVVGVDASTGKILHRFESISVAHLAGFKNISTILKPGSGRKLAKGLRWFKESDYVEGSVELRTARANALPVVCLERNEHFLTTTEASEVFRTRGVLVNASHITSCCKKNRAIAGGYRWSYSTFTTEEIISNQTGPILDVEPIVPSNTPQTIVAFDETSGAKLAEFASKSEAARELGLSGASVIFNAMKRGGSVKGIRFVAKTDTAIKKLTEKKCGK